MLNKVLVFKNSGWCEKLKTSYFTGRYQPKDEKEFAALEEFADEIIELGKVEGKKESTDLPKDENKTDSEDGGENKTAPEEFTDEQIEELRAKAKEKKISNWHVKAPSTLVKELGLDV